VFRQLFFPESQSFAGNTMPGARNLLKCFTGTHLQTATAGHIGFVRDAQAL